MKKYHETKRRMKTPVIAFGQIDSGVIVFVRPEERIASDCISWEICFEAQRSDKPSKMYSWLVFPGKQTTESAIAAFKKRIRQDPVEASRLVVFEVSPPPLVNLITSVMVVRMFPDDTQFAGSLKITRQQLEFHDER